MNDIPFEIKQKVIQQLQEEDGTATQADLLALVADRTAREALQISLRGLVLLSMTSSTWREACKPWLKATLRITGHYGAKQLKVLEAAEGEHLRLLIWHDSRESDAAVERLERIAAGAPRLQAIALNSAAVRNAPVVIAALPGACAQLSAVKLECTAGTASTLAGLLSRCTNIRHLDVDFVGTQAAALTLMGSIKALEQIEYLCFSWNNVPEVVLGEGGWHSRPKHLRWSSSYGGVLLAGARLAGEFAGSLESFDFRGRLFGSQGEFCVPVPRKRRVFDKLCHIGFLLDPDWSLAFGRLMGSPEMQDLLDSHAMGTPGSRIYISSGPRSFDWLYKILTSHPRLANVTVELDKGTHNPNFVWLAALFSSQLDLTALFRQRNVYLRLKQGRHQLRTLFKNPPMASDPFAGRTLISDGSLVTPMGPEVDDSVAFLHLYAAQHAQR